MRRASAAARSAMKVCQYVLLGPALSFVGLGFCQGITKENDLHGPPVKIRGHRQHEGGGVSPYVDNACSFVASIAFNTLIGDDLVTIQLHTA